MAKLKGLVKQIAKLEDPVPQDFDPEEDGPLKDSDADSEEESDDGLAGTEHYAEVGKGQLRKPEEIALGPEYAGSRVSRKALFDNDDEDEDKDDVDSIADSQDDDDIANSKIADPDDLDLNIDMDDKDGDIDSDEAFGESDMEKFKKFTFRGSGKPRGVKGVKSHPTAVDFMSSSEDEGLATNGSNPHDMETDEDLLGIEAHHLDPEADEDILDAENQHDDVENQDGSDEDDQEKEEVEDNSTEDNSVDGPSDQSDNESQSSDEEVDDASDDEDEDGEKARRAELRKIMGEEQKTVVATISQAAKADEVKGNAVKQQRKTFDSLLNVRMVLQKALVATNSLATVEDKGVTDTPSKPYEAAEEAAIKLWNTLDQIRHQLSKANPSIKAGQKRKRDIEASTPSSEIWARMQNSEVSVIDNRQTTLEKWSAKVRGATSLPLSRKLNPTAPQQSITSVLQDQLASSDHLVRKTKMPRSCAPIQRDLKLMEDPNIYDDSTFYQLLLKELVDQRRVESLTVPIGEGGKTIHWTALKDAKTKNNVDTKASKGRKLRYTVHEKLQNFMAPEDRGSWEPLAIDRFFGTLLGQKMTLGEDDANISDEEGGGPTEEQGLMLFRS